MKRKVFSAILLLITFLNMAFIFYHSAKNAESSLGESKKIANTIVATVQGEDKSVGKELENIEYRQAVNRMNKRMRDCLHALEYFPMGFCLTLLFAINLKGKHKVMPSSVAALGISLLYAVSDEVHQHFVPGRTFQLIDIAHDAMGFCAGTALAVIAVVAYGYFTRAAKKTKHI